MFDSLFGIATCLAPYMVLLLSFTLLSPLLLAGIVAVFGRSYLSCRQSGLLATVGVALSFLGSLLLLICLLQARDHGTASKSSLSENYYLASFLGVPYELHTEQVIRGSSSSAAYRDLREHNTNSGMLNHKEAVDNVARSSLDMKHQDDRAHREGDVEVADIKIKSTANALTVTQHDKSATLATIAAYASGWSIKLDMISALMLLMVTSVSLMVHIYAMGYFHHDSGTYRFMVYLSCFTFFMLLLATASNPMMMFVGWEGVGLCSYLLIGYHFQNLSAINASYKAFLVNRVGDCCFVMGLVLYYYLLRTHDSVATVHEQVLHCFGLECQIVSLMALLFTFAAMTKSAQLFLHIWLPDAMEGPTPASALIHSATMVTAGVVLLLRLQAMLPEATVAPLSYKTLALCIGMATALFGALMALTRFDIKRIIAYSTCSQLGLMFVAFGSGGSVASLFHLLTHAFFKSLLFLGAGAVIHAMQGEQDIRHMQEVRNRITRYILLMFLIGGAALSGLFPFAGFYSKDLIFTSLYSLLLTADGAAAYCFGYLMIAAFFLVAFMTPLYIFRMIFVVFLSKNLASNNSHREHFHQTPWSMLLPMSYLALLSIFSGYIGHYFLERPRFIGIDIALGNNVTGVMIPLWCHVLLYIIPFLGIMVAYKRYAMTNNLASIPCSYCAKFLEQEGYFNQIYSVIFAQPLLWLAKQVMTLDRGIVLFIDKILGTIKYLGLIMSKWKTEYCHHDIWNISFGCIVLLLLAVSKLL